jgi:hypothetical protein
METMVCSFSKSKKDDKIKWSFLEQRIFKIWFDTVIPLSIIFINILDCMMT